MNHLFQLRLLGIFFLFSITNGCSDVVHVSDVPLEFGSGAADKTGSVALDGSPPGLKEAPNIVIIMADDLGWKDVGYNGSEIRTPHLDRLAANGVELNRFYAHPTCSPTRASLMTGKSPLRLGIFAPLSKNNPTGLPLAESTLADQLKQRGYQTALTGKWHLGARDKAYLPNARGFDHFYGHTTGGVGYWDKVHGGGYDLQRNGKTVREEGYLTHLIAQEAVDVIGNRDRSRPLFLFASFNAPHLPNEAPKQTVEEYDEIENPYRRKHAAMVTEFDTAVGRIFQKLQDENMLENTIIWFMSDNGGLMAKPPPEWLPDWAFEAAVEWTFDIEATPRMMEFIRINLTEGGSDNSPLRDGKGSLWEGGMRVPSFVYWKGKLAPSKSNQMIAMQDVLPTLLTLSGDIADPEAIDGRSVWPALMDNAKLSSNPVVTQMGPAPVDLAVFVFPWKLILDSDGDAMLYNVEKDPSETNEISGRYPVITEQLKTVLQEFPKGKNVALPLQAIADDPDFFGGEEDRKPWADTVAVSQLRPKGKMR
ncbi:MAG: hypothetical protein Pars2KO_33160 [Parasphingorhabdus sp.]